jgi:hypothetical protein
METSSVFEKQCRTALLTLATYRFENSTPGALRCVGRAAYCRWLSLWPRAVVCQRYDDEWTCAAIGAPWFDAKSMALRCDGETQQAYVELAMRRALFNAFEVTFIVVLFVVFVGVAFVLRWILQRRQTRNRPPTRPYKTPNPHQHL